MTIWKKKCSFLYFFTVSSVASWRSSIHLPPTSVKKGYFSFSWLHHLKCPRRIDVGFSVSGGTDQTGSPLTRLPPWRNFTFIEWPNVLQLITQNSHNEKQCVNQAAAPWRGHRLNAKRSLLGPLQTGISLSDWLSGRGRRWWHFMQAGIGVLTKPSS